MNKKELTQEEVKLLKADYIASFIVLILGLFVLVTGICIMYQNTGADTWYYSPGFFPLFIGGVLIILSLIQIINKKKNGVSFKSINLSLIEEKIKSKEFLKMIVAILLLAIYVFGTFGRLHFVLATFLYLFTTMAFFKTDKFAIWKIAIISIMVSIGLYLFFSLVAKVPLQ